MQSSDLKDLLPLFVGLLTAAAALIGVAVTSYFNHRNTRATLDAQRQLRIDERRLERMEELLVLFERWEMNFSQVYLFDLRRHRGELTQVEVDELVKSLAVLEKGDIQRLSMLLRLHFPELGNQYATVQKARKAIVPFLRESKPTNPAAFVKEQERFEAQCEAFKQAVAGLPRLTSAA
jgi:hypothetical protein